MRVHHRRPTGTPPHRHPHPGLPLRPRQDRPHQPPPGPPPPRRRPPANPNARIHPRPRRPPPTLTSFSAIADRSVMVGLDPAIHAVQHAPAMASQPRSFQVSEPRVKPDDHCLGDSHGEPGHPWTCSANPVPARLRSQTPVGRISPCAIRHPRTTEPRGPPSSRAALAARRPQGYPSRRRPCIASPTGSQMTGNQPTPM